jgi:hypothetical protein
MSDRDKQYLLYCFAVPFLLVLAAIVLVAGPR